MSRPVILSHCRLTSQPDLSEAPFADVDYHSNDIRVVHQEYLPRRCISVDFGQNKLAEDGLPFEWPDHLEKIFLYDNLIVNADGIHWPTRLKHLDFYNNPLTSMPVPLSNSIEDLVLSRTEIESVETLPESLKELHMSQTRLVRLPAIMPQGLLKAILAENVLSFRGLPGNWGISLQYLDLAHNRLKVFPIGLPDTLEVLILTHNQIKMIPENLPEQLKQLNVNHNCIRQIEYRRRTHPIEVVCIENNQLVEKPSPASYWAKFILDGGNWNETRHQIAAGQIQKIWRISRIFPRIRAWYKMAKYKEELFIVSLHPDRILKTDDFSKWHFGC
jgi:Leucine-rich repeat (LRR) protein